MESSFSTAPVPSRFSPRTLNRPASSPWHSIGDPFKIQVPTAEKISRNAAFEATRFHVQSSISHAVCSPDWMRSLASSNQRGVTA